MKSQLVFAWDVTPFQGDASGSVDGFFKVEWNDESV